MKINNKKIVFALCAAAILLAACATPNPLRNVPLEQTNQVYGFLSGLWDGVTAIFAFIGNLFDNGRYGIYQVHNNGNWYDFGYLLGIGAFSSGFTASVKVTFK